MRSVQVTIRVDPSTLQQIEEAARAEADEADRLTGVPGHAPSRSRIVEHLITMGLRAHAEERRRVKEQNEAMG